MKTLEKGRQFVVDWSHRHRVFPGITAQPDCGSSMQAYSERPVNLLLIA